jgi:hypothetical protein
VSLEGTLETIALPDVLALLSVTAKTGELRIESGGGAGSVWFDAGRVSCFDVGNHRSVVDAVFALLRLKEGGFKFYTGTAALNPMEPEDVVPVLEEAENRLNQWPAIAAAIPSLLSELRLADSVEGTVMLRPDQWQLVTTIGGGRTVGDVLETRALGEFEGCKALKELIDLSLVSVATRPAPVPAFAPLSASAAPPPDLAEAPAGQNGWAPQAGMAEVADLSESAWATPLPEGGLSGEPAEEPAEEPAPAEPVNRGLLLKFLGSARN